MGSAKGRETQRTAISICLGLMGRPRSWQGGLMLSLVFTTIGRCRRATPLWPIVLFQTNWPE